MALLQEEEARHLLNRDRTQTHSAAASSANNMTSLSAKKRLARSVSDADVPSLAQAGSIARDLFFGEETQIGTRGNGIGQPKRTVDSEVFHKPAPTLVQTKITDFFGSGSSASLNEGPGPRTTSQHLPHSSTSSTLQNVKSVYDKVVNKAPLVLDQGFGNKFNTVGSIANSTIASSTTKPLTVTAIRENEAVKQRKLAAEHDAKLANAVFTSSAATDHALRKHKNLVRRVTSDGGDGLFSDFEDEPETDNNDGVVRLPNLFTQRSLASQNEDAGNPIAKS